MRKMLAGAAAGVWLLSASVQAEVVRFDISERAPAFAGRSFGDVGPYERITAQATIALDPGDDRNAVITDLALAPRNSRRKGRSVADVVILRPADPARGNGTLLLDVPNRGRKLAPQLFDDSPSPAPTTRKRRTMPASASCTASGYTMVWVGWQGDIPSKPGQMAMAAPVLTGVTGAVAPGIHFRQHHQPRPRDADLAGGRSRQPQGHRTRGLGRCAANAVRPHRAAGRSHDGRDHAAGGFRCRRAL